MAKRGRPKGSVDDAYWHKAVSFWVADQLRERVSTRVTAPRISKVLKQQTLGKRSAESIRKMVTAVNKRRIEDDAFAASTSWLLATMIEAKQLLGAQDGVIVPGQLHRVEGKLVSDPVRVAKSRRR